MNAMGRKKSNEYFKPYINREEKHGYNKNGSDYRQENIHHIVPRSRMGTNIEENKKKLYTCLHDALHRVHGNATPREQLIQLMFINATALTDEFKNDVMRILDETDDRYYYKNGILHKK